MSILDVGLGAQAVEDRPRHLKPETPIGEPAVVLTGASRRRSRQTIGGTRLPTDGGQTVGPRQREEAGRQRGVDRWEEISARDTHTRLAGGPDELGGAHRSADITDAGRRIHGGDEPLQHKRVEFRREAHRTLRRHVHETAQVEHRERVGISCLHHRGFEVRALDLQAEHVVARCTTRRLQLLRLRHALVGQCEVLLLDLNQAPCEKRFEIGALDIHHHVATHFGSRSPCRTARCAGGLRTGHHTPAEKERLLQLGVGLIGERLCEGCTDDRRARILHDLVVAAVQSQLWQAGGACDTDLCIGDIDARIGRAHLLAVAERTLHGGVEGEHERVDGGPLTA